MFTSKAGMPRRPVKLSANIGRPVASEKDEKDVATTWRW
jgi:hypothetical protein